jgi:hypothetical protein
MDFLKLLKLDALVDNIKGYVETKIELLKLEAQEKIAHLITVVLLIMTLVFFGTLAFMFLNLALGGFLNEVLKSQYLGYLIVGLFYLFLMIILAFNISKGWIHKIIKQKTASLFTRKSK